MEEEKNYLKHLSNHNLGYPLTWIFHGGKEDSKIRERALFIVCKNNESNALSFEELLEFDKSFKIYHRNIQSIAIELKIKNIFLIKSNDIFQLRAVSYNLRPQINFTRPNIRSILESILLDYMAAKILDMVPNDMKNVNDIKIFIK